MKYVKVAVLGSIALALAACQTTRPVPPGMYHSQQKYLTFDNHKAMVGAIDTTGAYTFGWAWGYDDVEEAIENARAGCLSNKDSYEVIGECKLHFIGNQNVRNLKGEELKQAIAKYVEEEKAL